MFLERENTNLIVSNKLISKGSTLPTILKILEKILLPKKLNVHHCLKLQKQ